MNAVSLIFVPMLALSAVLASLLAARAGRIARDYLRFACVLYFALAACLETAAILSGAPGAAFAAAVTQIVAAVAPVSLALALFAGFEHPPAPVAAAVLLILACIAGIAAAATGQGALAYAPLAASACAMLALCLRRWPADRRSAAHAFLSVCALLCAAAAAQTKAPGAALTLFLSATVLGFALALARSRLAIVETRDFRAAPVAVSRKP